MRTCQCPQGSGPCLKETLSDLCWPCWMAGNGKRECLHSIALRTKEDPDGTVRQLPREHLD